MTPACGARSASSSPTAACFALSASRPARAEEHGDEQVVAVLCGPDGAPVELAETLLSTEYGPDGIQRRATLELWMDEGAASLCGAPEA